MTATLPLYHSEKQSEREIKKMRHFLLLSVLWEGGGGTFKSRKVDGAMTHPLREGGGTLARQIIRIKDEEICKINLNFTLVFSNC